jgi:hypothetical protein
MLGIGKGLPQTAGKRHVAIRVKCKPDVFGSMIGVGNVPIALSLQYNLNALVPPGRTLHSLSDCLPSLLLDKISHRLRFNESVDVELSQRLFVGLSFRHKALEVGPMHTG